MKNLTFTVTLSDFGLEIHLPSEARLLLLEQNNARFDLNNDELFLLLKKGQIKMIANDLELIPKLEFDKVVILNVKAYELDANYLTQYLVNLAEEAGINLRDKAEPLKIPNNIEKACATYADEFLSALGAFGIKLEKKKAFSPKAQHRWKKGLSEIEFFVKRPDSQATIIWRKSNELVIKAGAKIAESGGMKSDGTPGLAYRFTQTLREEQKENWDPKTFITTADIVLKSVNEVGHFLYFAGTNSWLQLVDKEGRSIHELSVVQ
ncbi:hypothetical protein [Lactococcus cremoris]|uniref:hypothetical protein n=1 Tax=Lactococcus lactis subsp. cremoris TaxID=1359 RepID=UPI0024A6C833|nr:hypothetical protein [Lactococcus cremoris]